MKPRYNSKKNGQQTHPTSIFFLISSHMALDVAQEHQRKSFALPLHQLKEHYPSFPFDMHQPQISIPPF